jgi:hypothetical protein
MSGLSELREEIDRRRRARLIADALAEDLRPAPVREVRHRAIGVAPVHTVTSWTEAERAMTENPQ